MVSWRLLILLVCVVSVYGFDKGHASSKRDACWKLGTQCSDDCTSVLFCPGPGITPIVSVNCTSSIGPSKFCYADYETSPVCSADPSGCHVKESLPFQCAVPGDFPDIFNCGNGYKCGSGNPNPTDECSCPPGTMWLGNSANCSPDPNDIQSCCLDTRANCDDNRIVGGFGACSWAGSGYYYACIHGPGTTTVTVLQCPKGQIFSEDALGCISPTDQLSHIDKGKAVINETSIKQLPVCKSTSSNQCNYPGQVIHVPNSCNSYWVCDENLQPVLRKCGEGFIFDCTIEGKCVCVICSGNCPEICP